MSGISWFTLVELIVTITILAILALVGFLSMLDYSNDVKDAAIKANVKIISTAIGSESASMGISPRYYVVNDPVANLSWATAYLDGVPVALTGGDSNQIGTNYSAGNPDYSKLKLNAEKFKAAYDAPVSTNAIASAFQISTASAAYDSRYLAVWAVDTSVSTPSGRRRSNPYYQVAGFSPATGIVSVSGNYPGSQAGYAQGLVKDPNSASLSGALVDGGKTKIGP